MYCTKCGEESKNDAVFCHHCGTALKTGHRPVSPEWEAAADSLAGGCLWIAKMLMWLIGGCMAFACGCSGLGMLAAACYLFYHFANGISVIAPMFITEALSITTINGAWLAFGGAASVMISILLFLAAFGIVKGMLSVGKSRQRRMNGQPIL